jgi:hypothetical protein
VIKGVATSSDCVHAKACLWRDMEKHFGASRSDTTTWSQIPNGSAGILGRYEPTLYSLMRHYTNPTLPACIVTTSCIGAFHKVRGLGTSGHLIVSRLRFQKSGKTTI